MSMRTLTLLAFLLGVNACRRLSPPGPPVRLAGDFSDTIIVNSHLQHRLPVHAFDARGQAIVGAPIRFERTGGADVPIAPAGAVKCTQSGDVSVRAVLDTLTARVVVRCRLLGTVQIPSPIQFVLRGSPFCPPRALPIRAVRPRRPPPPPFP